MRTRELRTSDLRRVNDVVHRMHACRSYKELEHCTHVSMHELIDGDVTIWNDISMDCNINYGSTWPVFGQRFWDEVAPAIVENIQDHPVFDYLKRCRPKVAVTQLSDHLPVGRFVQTGLYAEAYRKWSCRYQCSIAVDTGSGSYFTPQVNRESREFSRREMGMLEALAPHVRLAYESIKRIEHLERSVAAIRSGRDARQSFWLVLGPLLYITNRSDNARVILATHFPAEGARFYLPGALKAHLQKVADEWTAAATPGVTCHASFLLETVGGELRFEFAKEDDLTYRLDGFEGSEQPSGTSSPKWSAVDLNSLTNREREVLRWLCVGKTNPEIAVIVGIARRTAENLTQSIFEKLGIHKRSALIRRYGHEPS